VPILNATCNIGTPTLKNIFLALNVGVGEKFQRQRLGPELSHPRSYFETGLASRNFEKKTIFHKNYADITRIDGNECMFALLT
jgi:hypothetical protein